MKYNELKNSSLDELLRKDEESRAELFQLKVKHKTSQLDKKNKIRETRRDIARVQTRLTALRSENKS
ncbi:50S ribosomal protein L29 [bacterium K02(2017)]|nr:50S ribosomal protein L29 [bacterium K02(2017)]